MTGIAVVELPADAAGEFISAVANAGEQATTGGKNVLKAAAWLARTSGRRFRDSNSAAASLRADIAGDHEDEGDDVGALVDLVVSLLRPAHAPAAVVPTSVPVEVRNKLGVYVYALVDPRTSEVFYVGKGQGNRVYQHVQAAIGDVKPDRSELVGSGALPPDLGHGG